VSVIAVSVSFVHCCSEKSSLIGGLDRCSVFSRVDGHESIDICARCVNKLYISITCCGLAFPLAVIISTLKYYVCQTCAKLLIVSHGHQYQH
jgi:hypothetical protein